MSYATPDQRARLIAGLLNLAAFLDANPDVPAPLYTSLLVFPSDGTDAERRAEIDVIAAFISAEPDEIVTGHYTVSRYFGPVEYRAVAIDRNTENRPDGE